MIQTRKLQKHASVTKQMLQITDFVVGYHGRRVQCVITVIVWVMDGHVTNLEMAEKLQG